MGHNNPCWENPVGFLRFVDYLVPDPYSNLFVQSAERVVNQHDVWLGIDSPREADALLLATREIDSSLSDFSEVSTWKHFKVIVKPTLDDSVYVEILIELAPVGDVVP